jgi:hypothetical protein
MARQSAREQGKQGIAQAANVYNSVAHGMSQSQTALFQGLQAIQREALNFVNRRLEHASDLMREYRNCRNMAEVVALQQRWLMEMSQDYYRQSMRLAEVMGSATSDELEMAQETGRELRGEVAEEGRTRQRRGQSRRRHNQQGGSLASHSATTH